MEAYLTPTYYEPRSGLLTLFLAAIFVMINMIAAYTAASYGMSARASPEVSMTKKELGMLLREAVRGEVEPLKKRMVAREDQISEAAEMAHQHQVRIGALGDDYTKAMREIGALQASLNAYMSSAAAGVIPRTPHQHRLRRPSTAQGPRATMIIDDNSDAESIYGDEDHESSPHASSPVQAHEVSSPQLEQDFDDELAELGGWGLDDEASEDVSDGKVTDQDAEGETDEEGEMPAPASPRTASRRLLKPQSQCKTKGAPFRGE
ncbi:hypothetical protein BDW02DRAFT_82911 [Decorospora gaudefroyi]|uniref:Uncharacterized protein n=1 Tax=Decorospora gaudefroyi TaxID=184978 RepID=A0A6A5KPD7_9PLEO|nr:hypothetical protein BDW02DRAFT_82911 [Decorospora gaudefroyi]